MVIVQLEISCGNLRAHPVWRLNEVIFVAFSTFIILAFVPLFLLYIFLAFFNALPSPQGWTALHMASAYGALPLVAALVAAQASSNTTDVLGWAPLNEACHRGFQGVAEELVVRGRADPNFLPDHKASDSAPFLRPPPQTPLGQACRGG